MFDGIKALLNSEKAIAAGVLVLLSGVFVLTGKMTVDAWQSYTQWILGIYVTGKTLQGSVSAWASTRAPSPTQNLDTGSSGGKSGG